ncbi:MAG: PEP-utilizing enzyme [Acidimicrobiales bacterium]
MRLLRPSINSLLPIVGALVVEEGGPLCHAAIVACKFGCSAVTGAQEATTRIPHGATAIAYGPLSALGPDMSRMVRHDQDEA